MDIWHRVSADGTWPIANNNSEPFWAMSTEDWVTQIDCMGMKGVAEPCGHYCLALELSSKSCPF